MPDGVETCHWDALQMVLNLSNPAPRRFTRPVLIGIVRFALCVPPLAKTVLIMLLIRSCHRSVRVGFGSDGWFDKMPGPALATAGTSLPRPTKSLGGGRTREN